MSELLSDFELDAIKETIAQGAGHASAALSQMADRKIDVQMPEIKVVRVEDIPQVVGDPSEVMMSVYVNIRGQIGDEESDIGNFLLLFPPKSAVRISCMLQGEECEDKSLNELSEMDVSALHEVGNILTGCGLSAVSEFLGIRLIEDIPTSSRDMVQASLDALMVNIAQKAENSMVFKTKFVFEDEDTQVYLFLIFEPEAVDLLRTKTRELLS